MLEKLAEWYLHRCGRFVLPRAFVGFAVGFGTAAKVSGGDQNYDCWQMLLPKNCQIIAMNHSTVINDPPKR